MEIITTIADFFEMVAALAALAVTYLMYCEVRRNKEIDQDNPDQ